MNKQDWAKVQAEGLTYLNDQPPTCSHCFARVELKDWRVGDEIDGEPVYRGTCYQCVRETLFCEERED